MAARPGAPRGASAEVGGLGELLEALEPGLRRQALTHSSWVRKRTESWGRLAFLGDSVLGLTIARDLYERFPGADIGRLTKIHGQAVSGRACAEIALLLGVPERVAELDELTGEGGISAAELVESERALASITEAVIGACYLQFGLQRVSEPIGEAFAHQVALASETMLDFKSALQEQLARRGQVVKYEVTDESGPPHKRTFEVTASVDGSVLGVGSGSTKKAAEQAAAELALESEEG